MFSELFNDSTQYAHSFLLKHSRVLDFQIWLTMNNWIRRELVLTEYGKSEKHGLVAYKSNDCG